MNENTRYAGFWIRVAASLIDSIIVNVIALIIGFTVGVVFGFVMASQGADSQAIEDLSGLLGGLIGMSVGFVYEVCFTSSKWQATIGKRAFGLKVVDAQGQRISFLRATGRYFAKIISAILLFIGYMMVGWTKRKQGLHDIIAATYVIVDAPLALPVVLPSAPQQPTPTQDEQNHA